jgi:hypothetical protein
MRARRVAVAGVIALAGLLVAYVSSSPARSHVGTAASKTIGTASTSDFRVVLTATKLGGSTAPEARVTVTTSRKTGAGWRRTGTARLAGTYFWKTVTGPQAVCRLELRTTGGATSSPRAVVEVLQTPSLGCGPQAAFSLTG